MQILERQKLILTYILVFIGLVGCLIVYLSNLEQYFDVSFVDEPSYLISGIHFFRDKSPVEYGPLYSFWYWIVSNFYIRPADIFYFNMKAMMFALPLSSFITLAAMRIKPVLCFMFSFFIAVSYINMFTPFVGHFAEIILLSAFAFLAIVKWSRFCQILFVSFVFLICTYFRPEYKLSFALVFVYALLDFVYRKRWQDVTECYTIGLFLISISVVYFLVGNPFEDKTNRTLLAFEQHYAFNYVKRNNLDVNPFLEYKQIMKKEFSEYTSVKQCVVSQPAKIIIHFSQNVLNYLWCVKSILIKSVLPSSIFLFVLTILSVGFSTRFVFSKLLDSVPWLNIGIIILYIMSAVPSLITVFLIAPRYHYLTTQYHLFLLPIAILMYKIGKRASFSNQDLILSLIIVLLVFFNHYEIKNSEYVDRTKPNLSNIVLVERATKDIKKIVGVCTSGFLLQMARPDAKIFQIADLAKMLDQKSSLIIVVNQNQEADMPLAITSNFTKIAGKEVIIYIKK